MFLLGHDGPTRRSSAARFGKMSTTDPRQLLLPVASPHQGLLPARLMEIAPDKPAATALISSCRSAAVRREPPTEHQLLGRSDAPLANAALPRSEHSVAEGAGLSTLEAREQRLRRAIGLGLEPRPDERPGRFMGIFRVRRWRRVFGVARGAGRTSPVRHAVPRPARRRPRSAFVVGGKWIRVRAASAASSCCTTRTAFSVRTQSSLAGTSIWQPVAGARPAGFAGSG